MIGGMRKRSSPDARVGVDSAKKGWASSSCDVARQFLELGRILSSWQSRQARNAPGALSPAPESLIRQLRLVNAPHVRFEGDAVPTDGIGQASLDVRFQTQIIRNLDRSLAVMAERQRRRFVARTEQVATERVIVARAVATIVRRELGAVRVVWSCTQRRSRAEQPDGGVQVRVGKLQRHHRPERIIEPARKGILAEAAELGG